MNRRLFISKAIAGLVALLYKQTTGAGHALSAQDIRHRWIQGKASSEEIQRYLRIVKGSLSVRID